MGKRADVQATAPDVDIRDALALTRHVGDFDALRTQAFSYANLPASPYRAPGGRELGKDVSLWHRGAVVLAFNIHFQSALFSDHPGRGRTFTHQVRDGDFMAVDSQAHGSKRRDEGHDQQDQRQQNQAEEGLHLVEIIASG